MIKNLLNTNLLQKFTVEEFQKDFDNLMNNVENGESLVITSEHGDVVMIPYDDDVKELIRIHTELNNEAP